MAADLPPVIVGAGPAGLGAAAALVEAGMRPVVLDEAARPGGQGTRRLAPGLAPAAHRLLGRTGARDTAWREAQEDRVLAACDWRPDTLIWGVFGTALHVVHQGRHETLPFDRLLIATGATDRCLAFPGWTLPGVFALGGAQVALKQHAALIGQRVVFAGASPLLYLAAVQYLRMGLRDLTVIDSTPMAAKLRAAPGMALTAPGTLLEGLGLMRELRAAGVRLVFGAQVARATGTDRLDGIEIHHADGRSERLECDALAFGQGLRPETQLAELAGAEFHFDPALRGWFPITDSDGRAGPHLWLAGDGAMTGGRSAAARSGRLAALSMLAAQPEGTRPLADNISALRRSVRRLRRFQHHLATAFRWPQDQTARLPDETIVCRCERVTAGQIRQAITQVAGPVDVNRVKAITRCGMGRCQGRYCGLTLQDLTAVTSGRPAAAVGRLRAQAPVRPIPIGSAEEEGASP